MAKPLVISDPVHRYLRVAAHERVVIDHPITQRLRRITQTGLVEFVYPEARSSRFVLSLGAMHFASRFVISAFENASSEDVRRFHEEIKQAHHEEYYCNHADRCDLLKEDDKSSTGGLAARRAVFNDESLQSDSEIRGWLGVVEAATRLAALFHDLGHLPFSHDFEFALKAYVQEQKGARKQLGDDLFQALSDKPHESIGHRLADVVFRNIIEKSDSKPGVRFAYHLAKLILDQEPSYGTTRASQVGALGWLHTLIDWDVDVDRADYLLRDGRALGLEFAAYNIDQLIRNLVLVRHKKYGFVTAVDERGFNALESYCLARARSSQVIIRHHKVAQLDAAFRYASAEALKSDLSSPFLDELSMIFRKDLTAEQAQKLLSSFAERDDPWWIGILRQLDRGKDKLLDASLGLILEREPNLRSVWKRKGQLTAEQRKKINDFRKLTNVAVLGKQIVGLRKNHNVLLVIHNFKPYSTLPGSQHSQMMVRTKKGLRSASELSPLIQSLRKAWQDDVHVHAFTLKSSTMSVEEVIEKMTIVSPPAGSPRRTQATSRRLKTSKGSVSARRGKSKGR